MPDHTNVVVYLRAQDVRLLRERGIEDPARWVRATIKDAVTAEREALNITRRGAPPGIVTGYTDPSE